MELSKEITSFVLRLVDRVSSYRVPPKLFKDLMSKRSVYESQREENQEKKKENEERLKKQKEEKWAKMTAKERKKALEIERKRAKNRMRKLKVT